MDRFVEIKPRPQRFKRGGHRATLFVYAMEAFDNMAFIAMAVSIVTYFYDFMNFSLTKSATTFTNFSGTAYLLTLVGGFVSDTYLSRFTTCVIFGSMELLGYTLLALQAGIHELRPNPCTDITIRQNGQCEKASSSQVAILFAGIYLIALGSGGIKAALPALGAEQYEDDDPKKATKVSSFFNWFLYSLVVGSMVGVTFVAWLTNEKGWKWGFATCAIAIFFSIVLICLGKPFYLNINVHKESPLVRVLQVLVVAVKNRNLPIPGSEDELHEIHEKIEGEYDEVLPRSAQFRFLDRAATIRNTADSETTSKNFHGPWSLCTVTQVEDLKILIRMGPVFLSTIFMNTCLAQLQTFSIQQATTLDRSIGSFKVPVSSLQMIPLTFIFIMIPVYDRIFVPVARKITGYPSGIRHLQRVGVGLFLSIISMAVAALVETRRKNLAISHNLVDTNDPLPMTLWWLGFQFGIFGAADMFTLVGLLEFFHEESSVRMKSLGTAISWCSFAFGYYMSTVVVEVVNKVSGGWLESSNLNRDHLDYFYWLLAVLSVINFVIFLTCASWYKYKVVETKQGDEEVGHVGLSPMVPTPLETPTPQHTPNSRWSPIPLLSWGKK